MPQSSNTIIARHTNSQATPDWPSRTSTSARSTRTAVVHDHLPHLLGVVTALAYQPHTSSRLRGKRPSPEHVPAAPDHRQHLKQHLGGQVALPRQRLSRPSALTAATPSPAECARVHQFARTAQQHPDSVADQIRPREPRPEHQPRPAELLTKVSGNRRELKQLHSNTNPQRGHEHHHRTDRGRDKADAQIHRSRVQDVSRVINDRTAPGKLKTQPGTDHENQQKHNHTAMTPNRMHRSGLPHGVESEHQPPVDPVRSDADHARVAS